jgi:hypothetical protein
MTKLTSRRQDLQPQFNDTAAAVTYPHLTHNVLNFYNADLFNTPFSIKHTDALDEG